MESETLAEAQYNLSMPEANREKQRRPLYGKAWRKHLQAQGRAL